MISQLLINNFLIIYPLEFNPAYIAAEIEETTFQMFKETNSKYKNRIKSRVMNLRDKRNTALKAMIIEGDIAPARFAKMTAEVCFIRLNYVVFVFEKRISMFRIGGWSISVPFEQ